MFFTKRTMNRTYEDHGQRVRHSERSLDIDVILNCNAERGEKTESSCVVAKEQRAAQGRARMAGTGASRTRQKS